LVEKSRSVKIRMKIIIQPEDEADLVAVCKAIAPEVSSLADKKRGEVAAECSGDRLVIEISCGSASDARALLNAYAYLLGSLAKVMTSGL